MSHLALAPVVARYRSPDERWRAIDDQWLLAAEQLALKLDNVVNNLSMVLAFEFTATKEVLLFAADAQIGNWLSWQKPVWTLTDGRTRTEVRAHDLLARTVFYKVGHHGSHNATLKDGGLEAMSHPGLVAATPWKPGDGSFVDAPLEDLVARHKLDKLPEFLAQWSGKALPALA